MKNLVKRWLIIGLIVISIILFMTCENPSNVFLGTGNLEDTVPPTISITSHIGSQRVNGNINISGIAKDDVLIKEVRLYLYKEIIVVINGKEEKKFEKELIKTTGVSHWDGIYSFPIDTTIYEDGTYIFMVEAVDAVSNTASENLILIFDNHGPRVLINSPNDDNNIPVTGPFTADVSLISSRETMYVEWEIYVQDDPTIRVPSEGTAISKNDDEREPIATPDKIGYSFHVLDVLGLSGQKGKIEKYKDGFFGGEGCYIVIRVRGYDSLGRVSKTWAEKVVGINFELYKPTVYITMPNATDETTANTSGSSGILITGAVNSASPLKELILSVKNIDIPTEKGDIHIPVSDLRGTPPYLEFSYPLEKKLPDLIDAGLSDGTYLIKGQAITEDGVEGERTKNYFFKIDANYPTVWFLTPPDGVCPTNGAWLKGSTPVTVEAVARAGGSPLTKVEYKIEYEDDINPPWKNYPLGSKPEEVNISIPIAENIRNNGGKVQVYIKASKKEIEGYPQVLILNFDCRPPDVSIDQSLIDQSKGGKNEKVFNKTVTIQGKAKDYIDKVGRIDGNIPTGNVVVKIKEDDVTIDNVRGIEDWSVVFDTSRYGQDGEVTKTIIVTVTDSVGNSTSKELPLRINQLTDIPWVAVDSSFSDGAIIWGSVSVSGRAYDDDRVKRVLYKIVDADESADHNREYQDTSPRKPGFITTTDLESGLPDLALWKEAQGTTDWQILLKCGVDIDEGEYILYVAAEDTNKLYEDPDDSDKSIGKRTYFRNDLYYNENYNEENNNIGKNRGYRPRNPNGNIVVRDRVRFKVDPNAPVINFYETSDTSASEGDLKPAPSLEKYTSVNKTIWGKVTIINDTNKNACIERLDVSIVGTKKDGSAPDTMSFPADGPSKYGFEIISGMGTNKVIFSYTLDKDRFNDGEIEIHVSATSDVGRKSEDKYIIIFLDTKEPIPTLNPPSLSDGWTKITERISDSDKNLVDSDVTIDRWTMLTNDIIIKGGASDPDPSSGLSGKDGNLLGGRLRLKHENNSFSRELPVIGSPSSWTYNTILDTSIPDGLYDIEYEQSDVAGNVDKKLISSTTAGNKVRLARYLPKFRSGYVYSKDNIIRDGMSIKQIGDYSVTFYKDSGDVYQGFQRVALYLYKDPIIDKYISNPNLITVGEERWSATGPKNDYYNGTSTESNDPAVFQKTYKVENFDFKSPPPIIPKYLIIEITDKAGYTYKKSVLINIDFVNPVQEFKLTSVKGNTPTANMNRQMADATGSKVLSAIGYSSSLWIKLDAADRYGFTWATGIDQSIDAAISVLLSDNSNNWQVLDQTTNDYTPLKMGNYYKKDTKTFFDNGSAEIYLHYIIEDNAGNINKGILTLIKEPKTPRLSSLTFGYGTDYASTISSTEFKTEEVWINNTRLSSVRGVVNLNGCSSLLNVVVSSPDFAGPKPYFPRPDINTITNTGNYVSIIPSTPAAGSSITGNTFIWNGGNTLGGPNIGGIINNIDGTNPTNHTLTFLVTSDLYTNMDDTITIFYDNTPPTISNLTISEDPAKDGRVFTLSAAGVPQRASATTDGSSISGNVLISGSIFDNNGDRHDVADIKKNLTITIGSKPDIPGSAITVEKDLANDNSGKTFTFKYQYNTKDFGEVKKNVPIKVTVHDKAMNKGEKTIIATIAPYLLSIRTNVDYVKDVRKYNSTTKVWENTDDKMRYSYRINDSGNITVEGFNLYNSPNNPKIRYIRTADNGVVLNDVTSYSSTSNTTSSIGDTIIGFNPNPSGGTYNSTLKNGYFTLKVGAEDIETNRKYLYIFENYGASTYDIFTDEQDMMIDPYTNATHPLAVFLLQKHFPNGQAPAQKTRYGFGNNETTGINGSGTYRGYETALNTFVTLSGSDTSVMGSTYGANYISHGHNRYWFISVARDTAKTAVGSQKDSTFYLYAADTENNPSATIGAFVAGSKNYWNNMATTTVADMNLTFSPYTTTGNAVYMPVNDWRDGVTSGFLGDTASGGTANNRTLRNAWRSGAVEWNNTSGANNDCNNDICGKDWGTIWGDIIAYDDNIYTVGYNASISKTYYRRINNTATKSKKYPEKNPLLLDFEGQQPAVAIYTGATAGKEVYIIAIDITNRAVKISRITNDDINNTGYTTSNINSIFSNSGSTATIITGCDSGYPAIAVDATNIHVVYQDLVAGTIKYSRNARSTWSNTSSWTTNTINLDNASAPGYYSHLTLDSVTGRPIITYLSLGAVGTRDAVKIARATTDNPTSVANWEIVTVPMQNNISLVKVRGYNWKGRIIGSAKSTYPEVFREYSNMTP